MVRFLAPQYFNFKSQKGTAEKLRHSSIRKYTVRGTNSDPKSFKQKQPLKIQAIDPSNKYSITVELR